MTSKPHSAPLLPPNSKLKEGTLPPNPLTITSVNDEINLRQSQMVLEHNEIKHRYNLAVLDKSRVSAERSLKKEMEKDRAEEKKRQKKKEKEIEAEKKKKEKERQKMVKENVNVKGYTEKQLGQKGSYKPRTTFFWNS